MKGMIQHLIYVIQSNQIKPANRTRQFSASSNPILLPLEPDPGTISLRPLGSFIPPPTLDPNPVPDPDPVPNPVPSPDKSETVGTTYTKILFAILFTIFVKSATESVTNFAYFTKIGKNGRLKILSASHDDIRFVMEFKSFARSKIPSNQSLDFCAEW